MRPWNHETMRRCEERVSRADHRHTAAPPTVYGTVMNYVTLRMLGMGPDDGPMTQIRALIHEMGEYPYTLERY